jgi:hypothetical protein
VQRHPSNAAIIFPSINDYDFSNCRLHLGMISEDGNSVPCLQDDYKENLGHSILIHLSLIEVFVDIFLIKMEAPCLLFQTLRMIHKSWSSILNVWINLDIAKSILKGACQCLVAVAVAVAVVIVIVCNGCSLWELPELYHMIWSTGKWRKKFCLTFRYFG